MTRQRLPRGSGDELRDEIVTAAEALMLANGSDDAVSIRSVAASVGVTAPSIYRHFADKEALIVAVCEKQLQAFTDHMAGAAAAATDPLEELRAQGQAYIRFGLQHPEAYAFMFMRPRASVIGHHSTASIAQGEPEAFLALVGAVERATRAGTLIAPDPRHAACVIWSAVHGLTSLLIALPHFSWTDQQALVDDVLFSAVAPFMAQ